MRSESRNGEKAYGREMENRKYSVLMSVYQREKADYLQQSILSMLQQTVAPSDFVLVCDGPLTAELDRVINQFEQDYPQLFQIVRLEENHGLGAALAAGIMHCRYSLVARMDSDDISAADRCERQLELFATKKSSIVGANIAEFQGEISNITAYRKVPESDSQIKAFARRRNPFNHPSVMFLKEAVLAAGNYQDCRGFEDYYLWVRMILKNNSCYNIQENLVYMRVDEGMYQRRGSLSYALLACRARWRIYRLGFNRLGDFIVSSAGQIIISVVPLKLREKLYRGLLRG